MRVLLACALIALLSVSAYAQGASGGKKRGRHAQTTEQPKKIDDRAYKSALKSIPDAQKPADPWGSVRSGAH